MIKIRVEKKRGQTSIEFFKTFARDSCPPRLPSSPRMFYRATR